MPPTPPHRSSLKTPAKRTRVPSTSSALHKPFRSPLLTPRPPSSTAPGIPASVKLASTPATSPTKRPSPASAPSTTTPLKRLCAATKSPSSLTRPDPELAAAQGEHTRLLARQRELKAQIATAQQALKLEKSTKGDEALEREVRRWRLAARGAAEALYAVASDKVSRLSGPAGSGWREALVGRKRGWEEFEETVPRRASGDEAEDEGIGGEGEMKGESGAGGGEEGEWGFGVMLGLLGIPEGLVGWDRKGECWVD